MEMHMLRSGFHWVCVAVSGGDKGKSRCWCLKLSQKWWIGSVKASRGSLWSLVLQSTVEVKLTLAGSALTYLIICFSDPLMFAYEECLPAECLRWLLTLEGIPLWFPKGNGYSNEARGLIMSAVYGRFWSQGRAFFPFHSWWNEVMRRTLMPMECKIPRKHHHCPAQAYIYTLRWLSFWWKLCLKDIVKQNFGELG